VEVHVVVSETADHEVVTVTLVGVMVLTLKEMRELIAASAQTTALSM
jgi:hypothetical protein